MTGREGEGQAEHAGGERRMNLRLKVRSVLLFLPVLPLLSAQAPNPSAPANFIRSVAVV